MHKKKPGALSTPLVVMFVQLMPSVLEEKPPSSGARVVGTGKREPVLFGLGVGYRF